MHEYEFRLVVQDSSSFLPLLERLGYPIRKYMVYYAEPHFRFRNRQWETKRRKEILAVYYDGLWFKFAHSIETAFSFWSQKTCQAFLHKVGDFQDPFMKEYRSAITIDSQTQLYTFQNEDNTYRLVFEYEYGTFSKPLTILPTNSLLASLKKYKRFYDLLRPYPIPAYILKETFFRKPVSCVQSIPVGKQYLYAHKLDGIFGLVYSYSDKIKEKWEGYESIIRNNLSLGDGIVFTAERLEERVVLLDVYQVQGYDVAKWCRRDVLTEFLPKLKLVEGYSIQTYSLNASLPETSFKTDGVIIHDTQQDVVYKLKFKHSVDLVYYQGYFYLPNGRFKAMKEGLEDGCVYEISTADGEVLRKRLDRFKGNTAAQLENIFKTGWFSPTIEPLPEPKKKRKRNSTKL